MEAQKIIDIKEGISGNPEYRMAGPINVTICDGEQIAVIGDNAAGKTRLIESMTGACPLKGTALQYDFTPSPFRLVSENIKYISFRDTYDGADGNYYLQKRWNQQDIDEEIPTAGILLDKAYAAAEDATGRFLDEKARLGVSRGRAMLKEKLYEMFHLDGLLDKYIITLSSGELRKFQLARSLLAMPRVIILDNPFIGLDAPTRTQLSELLSVLASEMKLLIILVMSKVDIMPDFITHVIPVEGLEVKTKLPVKDYLENRGETIQELDDGLVGMIDGIPFKNLEDEKFYPSGDGAEIVRCNSVSIRYGDRTILRNLDWTVHEGEKWALSGENGAGKSTLLSLVCADNPQSYACDIELFGHKRGTGESIWEIKRHIGYVSPEMHRAYLKNIPALDIVASGLFDTVGLFMHPSEEQLETCRTWMRIFGIDNLADRSYMKISSGEQRLCLLARAFVKDPELLILDEPLHGLDVKQSGMARQIIDRFMSRPHKTLIMVTHFESELPECINRRLYLKKQH